MASNALPNYGNLPENELEVPTFIAPDMPDTYSKMVFTPVIGGFKFAGSNYIFGYLAVPSLHNLCATSLIMSCFMTTYGVMDFNLPELATMGKIGKNGDWYERVYIIARRSLARSMVTAMERWGKPSFLAFDRTGKAGATRPTMELACTMDHGGVIGELHVRPLPSKLKFHTYTIHGAPKMLECGSFKNYSAEYNVGPAVLHRTRREENINGFAGWPANVPVPRAVVEAYTPEVVQAMFDMFGSRGYVPAANLRWE